MPTHIAHTHTQGLPVKCPLLFDMGAANIEEVSTEVHSRGVPLFWNVQILKEGYEWNTAFWFPWGCPIPLKDSYLSHKVCPQIYPLHTPYLLQYLGVYLF